MRQPLDQPASELGLERLNLLRKAGLRDMQLLGRLGERGGVDDGNPVLELSKVHSIESLYLIITGYCDDKEAVFEFRPYRA